MPDAPLLTDRTRLHRKPSRGSHDLTVVEAILDEALVCHVGFTGRTGPMVIPTAFVRIADKVYVHGSAANGMLRTLSEGHEACVAVTLVDGLVLSRTAFHHSMNYRSVVLFGRPARVTDDAEKRRALDALIDKMVPNRSAECRRANRAELDATLVLAFPVAEASAKVRSGPPLPDDPPDQALPHWAGVIPLVTTRGTPIPASGPAP
ncbi:MAG: pyridoxamine 5'-phosphate oxidase family protein [Deltaproteobacteria bacterium]|nr:pyridoxamine 5'-phosphate oxidase family protein [Deltaproteobacteria bacterium]